MSADIDKHMRELERFELMLWRMLSQLDRLTAVTSSRKAKRLVVSAYCLFFRGITPRQMEYLGLARSGTGAAEKYLSRNATRDVADSILPSSKSGEVRGPHSKEALLFGFHLEKIGCFVYELSRYGLDVAVYELLTLPGDFLCGVNRDSIDYLRRRLMRNGSLISAPKADHVISARDVGAYGYRVLHLSPFTYQTECRLLENGQFLSREAALAMRNSSTAQICDGYISFPAVVGNPDTRTEIFVEQDMDTQRPGYLKQHKLSHYGDIIRYQTLRNSAAVTLLFSICTVRKAKARKKPDKNSYRPKLRQEVAIRSFESFGERWRDCILSELIRLSEFSYRNLGEFQTHLKNQLQVFYEYEAAAHAHGIANPTIGGLMDYLLGEEAPDAADALFYSMRQSYKTRRLTFFQVAYKEEAFRELYLDGYSVCCIDNHFVDAMFPCLIHPFSMPAASDAFVTRTAAHLTIERFAGKYLSAKPNSLAYEPYTRCGDITFRNHYFDAENDTHIYVENISDDFGGRYRVMHYLNYPSIQQKGYLIALVEDDWMDQCHLPPTKRRTDHLWTELSSSRYAALLIKRAAAGVPREKLSYGLPLHIAFITYREYLNGDIHPRELYADVSGNLCI